MPLALSFWQFKDRAFCIYVALLRKSAHKKRAHTGPWSVRLKKSLVFQLGPHAQLDHLINLSIDLIQIFQPDNVF